MSHALKDEGQNGRKSGSTGFRKVAEVGFWKKPIGLGYHLRPLFLVLRDFGVSLIGLISRLPDQAGWLYDTYCPTAALATPQKILSNEKPVEFKMLGFSYRTRTYFSILISVTDTCSRPLWVLSGAKKWIWGCLSRLWVRGTLMQDQFPLAHYLYLLGSSWNTKQ